MHLREGDAGGYAQGADGALWGIPPRKPRAEAALTRGCQCGRMECEDVCAEPCRFQRSYCSEGCQTRGLPRCQNEYQMSTTSSFWVCFFVPFRCQVCRKIN